MVSIRARLPEPWTRDSYKVNLGGTVWASVDNDHHDVGHTAVWSQEHLVVAAREPSVVALDGFCGEYEIPSDDRGATYGVLGEARVVSLPGVNRAGVEVWVETDNSSEDLHGPICMFGTPE